MSNQSSAAAQLQTMSSPAEREAGQGFWRTMFNAWIASYANRIDPEGKVLIEL
ncbi:hypothetical protein ACI48D_03215 [Massilia sp. LXY-6]|uniref:hypothetical protein n=1 Tax=Massilia sp. LXY-6 TaxID=3379823 RepID=UPI003EE358B2